MSRPLAPRSDAAPSEAASRRPFSLTRRSLLAATLSLPVVAAGAGTALADPGAEEGIVDVDLSTVAVVDADGAPVRQVDQAGGTMVGCSWKAAQPEQIAARGKLASSGEWGEWIALDQLSDPEDGKPVNSTQAVWLGGATSSIQIRALTQGADASEQLVAHVITTVVTESDRAAVGEKRSTTNTVQVRTLAATSSLSTYTPGVGGPQIISRASWGADESLVKGSPSYADELKAAVLHHSEGSNTYSASEAPGIIRGYLKYHTQTQGWKDIGYNALVDRFGNIYEGRVGGLDRNVVGAHATGSNTGSVGVCMVGSYTSTSVPSATLDAVADFMAWKLGGTFTLDVSSTTTLDSKKIPRVIGHRDARSVSTDCPGTRGYAALPGLRSRVQRRLDGFDTEYRKAYVAAGGRSALGTVTCIAQWFGPYTVTILTDGLVISGNGAGAIGYATPFSAAWQSSWGRPINSASSVGGKVMQGFENGTAVLENGHARLVSTRFKDVPMNLMYYTDIEKIATRGITTGYGDGTYRPAGEISRDAMVAFVYRAKGSPATTPPRRSPFSDLTPSTQFYKEICWARSAGIVAGYPDGTFRPTASVERQAVAAFLHRAAGSPKPPSSAPTFSDVPANHPFRTAISWLAAKGITTGWPDGTFRPDAKITRDAMAAFMVRWMSAVGL